MRRSGRTIGMGFVVAVVAQLSWPERALAEPHVAFEGKIGISAKDSIPDWPEAVKAPNGAPNIVVILLDDIGFGDAGTFGGAAQTPELDKLAAKGLRYNNFNTTAMCSPTRAALLTGRNHHRAGFGIVANAAGGYPGYNSVWKKSTASIAEVLRQQGYSTAAFGKWHNTPDWEITPKGPFERWPTGLGFEFFYGFMGPSGHENQWEPSKLYRNTSPVDPPATAAQGYHFTADMTNEAIRWVQTHQSLAPEKPYFLYFATGAVHWPHHAPDEWIEPYRGKFDQGWDRLNKEIFSRQKQLGVIPASAKLTRRPKEVPAWRSLSADQKKLYARQMEVYAGFIAHTDHELGRLLKAVRSGPAADNTLIFYIVGDNGSDGSGGLDGFTTVGNTVQEQLLYRDKLGSPHVPTNHYSQGWAWAGNTPFQYWKSIASHLGGIRAPLVVSWPARIKDQGGVRSQFTHVNDVAATLYDVIGISQPPRVDGVEQQPLDGMSFAQTFSSAAAPASHHAQYFEMLGNRAMYHDGWIASARSQSDDYAKDLWELYHVAEDFSQARNVARQDPGKLRELQSLFDVEATRNDVYPLGGASSAGKPSLTSGKRELVYSPDAQRIPYGLVPGLDDAYRMVADVTIPAGGAQGVIASFGDRTSGFTWYVKENLMLYESRAGAQRTVILSQSPLPRGDVLLAFEFIPESERPKDGVGLGSGVGRLYVNGKLTREARMQLQVREDSALYLGRVVGSPSDAFSPPFKFSGTLKSLRVELQ